MADELARDEQPQSSSSDRTTPVIKQEHMPGATDDEISAEQIEEIFSRARQTVKPIKTREAANETVSEDIFNFKLV